jgi:hypothetical protein
MQELDGEGVVDMKINIRELGQNFLIIAGVFATIYAFQIYVGYLVEKRLQDKDTIEAISSKVNPQVIFTSQGTILHGNAAMKYLFNNISVKPDHGTKGALESFEIIVEPKELIGNPPVLSCLNAQCVTKEPTRDGKFNIKYVIAVEGLVYTDEVTAEDIMKSIIFKLEIIN